MGSAIQLDRFMSYEPCDKGAHIRVHTDKRADAPVSERLFGLFTEHLGKNVYGGAWAQLFSNPGFELFDVVIEEIPESHRKDVAGVTFKRLHLAAEQFRMPTLPQYREVGLAPYWAAVPGGSGSFSLQPGLNGTAQQIVANPTGYNGIETPLFLPLHRTEDYKFQVNVLVSEAVSTAVTGNITLQIWQVMGTEAAGEPPTLDAPHTAPFGLDLRGMVEGDHPDGLLAEATIRLDRPHLQPGLWSKLRTVLRVPSAGVPRGARLKLRLLIPAGTTLLLDQALLFPTDAVEGWDPEVVHLLREMKLSVLRFPGGNFVSGYHWQDGIGPIEQRPEKPNPAWPEWEPNHVGTNEWLTLCELVNAEPMICVNAGNGSPEEAANWVRYCNDPVSTPWGGKRAADGHAAPYNVRIWEVGNEIWGDFQIGHTQAETYGERFGAFAQAMKAADPTIQLVAVGGSQPRVLINNEESCNFLGAVYAGQALQQYGEQIWAIAEHAVMGGVRLRNASAREAYLGLLAHTHHINTLNELNRQEISKLGLATRIAQTEQMVAVRGSNRPTDDSLAAAVMWAGFMNWFMRSDGLVPLFTRSAMINHGDLLAKVREVVYALPGYYVQAMYAQQPGRVPVAVHVATPVLHVDSQHFRAAELPCIDAVGLLSSDGTRLSVLVTNRHPENVIDTVIEPAGFTAREAAQATILAGPSYASQNYWYEPSHVKPLTIAVKAQQGAFRLSLPPHSVALLAFSQG